MPYNCSDETMNENVAALVNKDTRIGTKVRSFKTNIASFPPNVGTLVKNALMFLAIVMTFANNVAAFVKK